METADPLIPTPYVVRDAWRETHDVVSLVLEPRDEAALAPCAPGQFNMLWAFGVGEVPISVSGIATAGREVTHTIREAGNATRALCAAEPGDVIGVRGPFGHGWPLERARGRDVVVMAGGIGMAPLKPVLEHLESYREDFGRVTLLYGTRTADDILFRSDLETWRSRFHLDVEVTVDTATRGWASNVGAVTQLVPRAVFTPANTEAFICGPEIMMRFCIQLLRERGVPTESIHLSMERNMKCAIGLCGHCQWGRDFVCRDGPVFALDHVESRLLVRER